MTPSENLVGLAELADRVEALDGPSREVDALIAEHVYGWKRASIGPDYDGQNASEVLTPSGQPYCNGFQYPPRGALPLWYHVEDYTRDTRDPAFPKDAVRKQLAAALRARSAQ